MLLDPLAPLRSALLAPLFGFLPAFAAASAQEPPASEPALAADAAATSAALPDDLRRSLENRLRVLDVAAHPDDEDGSLLLSFALQGAETFVVYATRGEGGQNAIGQELGAGLGERREQEVLAAARITGATPWFLGFPDFGFSKRPDEAFARWGGREEVVRRLTRVIRVLRPHRVFTNHSQTGGHGHHQATSIALHEAIVAAADPTRFPEQIAEGLAPWQADALFVRWFAPAPDKPDKEAKKAAPPENSLHLDYDQASPLDASGKTIAALAHDALLRHESQGPWSAFDPKAAHAADYVITWTSRDARTPAQLPDHRAPLPPRPELAPFTVDDLLAALAIGELPSAETRDALLRTLLGVDLFFLDEDPLAPRAAWAPGESVTLFLLLHGRDDLYRGPECAAAVRALAEDAAGGIAIEGPAELVGVHSLEELVPDAQARAIWRDAFVAALTLRVRADATPTAPAPLTSRDAFAAAQREPIALRLPLKRGGVQVASLRIPVAKAIALPALAEVTPAPLPILRTRSDAAAQATLRLHFPTGRVPTAPLRLRAPDGFDFVTRDERGAARTSRSFLFELDPAGNVGSSAAPRFELPIVLRPTAVPPRREDRGSTIVPLALPIGFDGDDGATIATAAGEVAWIDALAPAAARVLFVAGADGTTAEALAALGVACETIAPDALAAADLARFTTVVLDARTLGASEPLRGQSARLRDWIGAGGHVVSLYHKSSEWNPYVKDGLTPAPVRLEVTDKRICEEEAPLRILLPGHELLLHPNVILLRDFDGWVQERALNVPNESYDVAFDEILAGSDRDEPELRGMLLDWSSPGGGSFTWCALALHRQLRAGHSGAYRILANLVGRPAPPQR